MATTQPGKYIVDVDDAGKIQSAVPYVESTTQKLESPQSWSQVIPAPVWFGIYMLPVVVILVTAIVIVKQQTMKVIERLGKFKRVAGPGFSMRIPFIDVVAATVDLRQRSIDVEIETKTKDNVFVKLDCTVQFEIQPDKAADSYYKLEDPEEQMAAYVLDVVRASVPTQTLDEVFEKKDEIAKAVAEELQEVMQAFGYTIKKTLIVDIAPNADVKAAMNEINAATRRQAAASATGEAEKIVMIKKAEAEAESKRLQGVGIAGERLAIAEGIKSSVVLLENVPGINQNEVLHTLLLTQYFDTLKGIGGEKGAKVILMPHSPGGMKDIESQVRNAMISASEASLPDRARRIMNNEQ